MPNKQGLVPDIGDEQVARLGLKIPCFHCNPFRNAKLPTCNGQLSKEAIGYKELNCRCCAEYYCSDPTVYGYQ